MHRIPVGVLGASGYAGRELCELLSAHPAVDLAFAAAHERRGSVARIGGRDVRFLATEDAPLDRAELVFSAMPHGASQCWVDRVSATGRRAIDLSADLRPGNGGEEAPYGLTEVNRDSLRGAAVIANPGCYPTAVLLALVPLLAADLVAPGALITIDAASGVTGAGNSPRPELLFGEVSENFRAYAVGNEHRHLPEMHALVATFGRDVDLLFTPHLLPVTRGLLATITVPVRSIPQDLMAPWREHYSGEPFVEISEELPELRHVVRRNVVRISARVARNVGRPVITVLAALDNLVKGAAGQAIQNANLALGLPESMGLPA